MIDYRSSLTQHLVADNNKKPVIVLVFANRKALQYTFSLATRSCAFAVVLYFFIG